MFDALGGIRQGLWLGSNDGTGEFGSLKGVAVDSDGNIYVANGNNRVEKFDSDGNVYVVDQGNQRVQKFDSEGEFLSMFGGEVNGDTEGNLYVGDWLRMQKINPEGKETTYHFEYVADGLLRRQSVPTKPFAKRRAFEMVTPLNKNG